MSRKPEEDIGSIIELTNLCKSLKVLPYAGGVLDQPAEIVDGMIAVLMVENEKEARDQVKGQARRAHR